MDLHSSTAQALTLYGEHGLGYTVGGSVHTLVGNSVAPLERLAVQIVVVGEPGRGPEVATNVLDATLHLPLGLRPVRLAQVHVEAHATGEVRHTTVPLVATLSVTLDNHHLGVVVQTAARNSPEVLEGVDMATDERRDIRPAHQLRVHRPREAQDHHERVHPALPKSVSSASCLDILYVPPQLNSACRLPEVLNTDQLLR